MHCVWKLRNATDAQQALCLPVVSLCHPASFDAFTLPAYVVCLLAVHAIALPAMSACIISCIGPPICFGTLSKSSQQMLQSIQSLSIMLNGVDFFFSRFLLGLHCLLAIGWWTKVHLADLLKYCELPAMSSYVICLPQVGGQECVW